MYQNILVEQQGQIARITINRPQQLNALNKSTISELNLCFTDKKSKTTAKVTQFFTKSRNN